MGRPNFSIDRISLSPAGAGLFLLPPLQSRSQPDRSFGGLRRCSQLAHFLRKAAERTAAATGRRIGTLLDDFSPAESENYFVNSGYASV